MFENMVDLMFKDEYDAYVFDMAPTANARRLLGMSKVYSLWVNKMLKSREEAQSLRELLSFTKKKQDDPLMNYLVSFRERIGHARELLTDVEQTAFFFVTLPEALPIAVIKRFINWFHDFGIPVGGVIVNMLIERPPSAPTPPTSSKNRVAMQHEHMRTVWEKFDGSVRAIVPLFETEIRGLPMLTRLSDFSSLDGLIPLDFRARSSTPSLSRFKMFSVADIVLARLAPDDDETSLVRIEPPDAGGLSSRCSTIRRKFTGETSSAGS